MLAAPSPTGARTSDPTAVIVCYGTRPQVIKASVVVPALRERWRVVTVDTGQHYDYDLHGRLYAQLGVERPDYLLDVRESDRSRQVARILTECASVLERERPRAVVVIGDTNSTVACALAASQARIPIVHVEAGLRSADLRMAEEANRRIVDAIAAVLCAPSQLAARTLQRERALGTVVVTGDVARDVLVRHLERLPSLPAIPGFPFADGRPYVHSTLHRAELTDSRELLAGVVRGLARAPFPVTVSAHPRLRAKLEEYDLIRELGDSVLVLEPLGYLESLACVRGARAVVTDSGGVQREAYWLGVPCITIRDQTEWRETVRAGANVVVAPARAADGIIHALDSWKRRQWRSTWDRDAYGRGDAASLIRDAVAALVDGLAPPA